MEKQLSPSLKFVIQTNLDKNVISKYRVMRGLLEKHGFTQEDLKSVSHAPYEIFKSFEDVKVEMGIMNTSLNKYGLSEDDELPEDVRNYLTQKLQIIDDETPLSDSKNNIIENRSSFTRLESVIKDSLDSMDYKVIYSNRRYTDSENKSYLEIIEGDFEILGVEIISQNSSDKTIGKGLCNLKIIIYTKPSKDGISVKQRELEIIGQREHLVKQKKMIFHHLTEIGSATDEVDEKVIEHMLSKFPFDKKCITIKYE